jgi:hypothetical protein
MTPIHTFDRFKTLALLATIVNIRAGESGKERN